MGQITEVHLEYQVSKVILSSEIRRLIMLIGLLLLGIMQLGYAAKITGVVSYEGKVPGKISVPIKVSDKQCITNNGGEPLYPEFLVLGEDKKTLGNVIVSIESGYDTEEEYEVPEDPIIIDQIGCKYTPHVIAIRAGQTLEIRNSDGIMHNVNCKAKVNKPFNIGMPKAVKKRNKKFAKPENPFELACDVHRWMQGYIQVFDHPFYDVTEKDGKYEINDLYEGEYVVKIWHERLPAVTKKVTIKDEDDEVELNIVLSRNGGR